MTDSSIRLNIRNLDLMFGAPPAAYDSVRIDSIDSCNVHCVYCHNARSGGQMDPADFERFLNERILSVRAFQFGCIMEPTLDPRLSDFMLIAAGSKARAKEAVILQTNGLLLHRHDATRFREAGLNMLAVSIDTVDDAIQKALRGGSSLGKALRNVESFSRALPEVGLKFMTTVTRLNIEGVPDLVRRGLAMGVKAFTLREVFYYPDSRIVDHARMPDLILGDGEFARLKTDILSSFSGQARFWFGDESALKDGVAKVSEASRM